MDSFVTGNRIKSIKVCKSTKKESNSSKMPAFRASNVIYTYNEIVSHRRAPVKSVKL